MKRNAVSILCRTKHIEFEYQIFCRLYSSRPCSDAITSNCDSGCPPRAGGRPQLAAALRCLRSCVALMDTE